MQATNSQADRDLYFFAVFTILAACILSSCQSPAPAVPTPIPTLAPTPTPTLAPSPTLTVAPPPTPSLAPTAKPAKTATPGWHLVWSDEFDGPSIDTTKWGYEIGNIRNHEAQYYTSRPENSYIENGNLVIQANREDYNGSAYTSASLNTKDKYSWTYGRFEMRAKIPTASGAWPAWWALGTDIDTVGWPQSGEIDMMEFFRLTSLYNVMDSQQQWTSYTEPFTDNTNYHVWVMEWNSSKEIKLYRDDVLEITYTGRDPAFDKPFYLLVNLAIGGDNGGDPSKTTFPLKYYIDYIRVYQR